MKEPSFKKRKIAVMMGGLSREREISLKTGKAILKALSEKGYPVIPLDVDAELLHEPLPGDVAAAMGGRPRVLGHGQRVGEVFGRR